MNIKCDNPDGCCKCHPDGHHEWESNQSSKYYARCPMCNKAMRIRDYVLDSKMRKLNQ